MAGGGGGGNSWIYMLVIGGALVGLGMGLHAAHMVAEGAVLGGLLGVGGLLVVFGSCEAMIKAVEGLAARLDMNEFVAGTMAGLASNVPELVMLGFVLAAKPRVGFIVTALTLHVGAATFGIYSALLPRDETGHARLPEPLVKLSTDLFACAGGVFFATGSLMVLLNTFEAGNHDGEALGAPDLYFLGFALLAVEAVAITRLVKRFSGSDAPEPAGASDAPPKELPSWGSIGGFAALGTAAAVVGGHAVGDFAGILVESLLHHGFSEMVGAIFLSIFAAAGALVMVFTAHRKGMYALALANASGQVTQVPFVVLPISLILLAVFGQTGVIELMPHGGILPIDLQTTAVVLLGFPSMLFLWKAIQDDGKVNWVETATMCAIFGTVMFFLAVHG